MITRFAPSPTGYLHLGHAYSAALNFDAAVRTGGQFILRIEDIDQTRCRPEFYDAIYEDLEWLGLEWDEPVRVQSQHLAEYEAALDGLRRRGLIYRCFKSRKDIEEAMSAPHAAPGEAFTGTPDPQEQEKLDNGEPFAWRLSMAKALAEVEDLGWMESADGNLVAHTADPAQFGDVVLGRKDSGTSYHLASVLDDALQGITHVIRGEELHEAADLHTLLQVLLGLPQPVYMHHPMLVNAQGERLSKRDGALSIRAMREAGRSAKDLFAAMDAAL